ncbi:MAG: cation:proton antiporter [Candidatus Aenigmarchaeota archaeon]|nr:cation:proton antiporter [Candidatus Aenigmarchaeota archaeon]
MMNIFLFLAIAFLFTFIVGELIEKIKVPWIFAALIFGFLLAIKNPFSQITNSSTFTFLANLGMYFLLFIIGFEIDLTKMEKKSGFIIGITGMTILLETIFGSLIVHFIFNYDWFVSLLVPLSFSTVGEAILVPILDEFGIVNTSLGQTIIGAGTLDDMIELATLILVVVLVGSTVHTHFKIGMTLVSLFVLFALTIGLTKLKKEGKQFSFINIETLFLFVIFTLFLFLGIGMYAESAPLAALLAGISLRTFIPDERLKYIESEVKTMCYGFFAPLFFLWVGSSINIKYLVMYPTLVLLVVIVSSLAKLIGSLIIGFKKIGVKQSILLGVGLSVRFSTSIIIIKILLDSGLIGSNLYSVIVASSIFFTFVVPITFSNLLVRWTKKKE